MNISIEALILSILGLWLGSNEWRIRNMDVRLRDAPSRDEVESLIDTKQEAVKVLQQEIKEDMKEVKEKIDTLISIQLSNK